MLLIILKDFENYAKETQDNDIIITGKNFGAGSSRQQAVDCFKALNNSCILAESYGSIYERNAINAAMPILTYSPEMIKELDLNDKDIIRVDFMKGEVTNKANGKVFKIDAFYDVQKEIYLNDGLL